MPKLSLGTVTPGTVGVVEARNAARRFHRGGEPPRVRDLLSGASVGR